MLLNDKTCPLCYKKKHKKKESCDVCDIIIKEFKKHE